MADPITGQPEELVAVEPPTAETALELSEATSAVSGYQPAALLWALYLPMFGLMAVAGGLAPAAAGAFAAGLGQSSWVVFVNTAAQEAVPDRVLGRVTVLISLVHRRFPATRAAARHAAVHRPRGASDI